MNFYFPIEKPSNCLNSTTKKPSCRKGQLGCIPYKFYSILSIEGFPSSLMVAQKHAGFMMYEARSSWSCPLALDLTKRLNGMLPSDDSFMIF